MITYWGSRLKLRQWAARHIRIEDHQRQTSGLEENHHHCRNREKCLRAAQT
jgi:hypothetical protein